MSGPNSDLLTVAQVADELKVPRKQVYGLIHHEGLPAVQLGERRYRIYRTELTAWLAGRRAAPSTGPNES